jgi:hypothetical protein
MDEKLKYYMDNYLTPLSESLDELSEKGYVEDFIMTDQGLKCRGSNKIYQPDDIVEMESFRLEEESDGGDEMVAYALKAKDGTVGKAVNARNIYADERLDAFLMKAGENISKDKGGKKAA